MNLKGTVSSLPDSTGNLFVQMGILRSKVNIRDIELIREDDISATLGDGSSRSYGAVSGVGISKSKKDLFTGKGLSFRLRTDQDVQVLQRIAGGQPDWHDRR